MQMRWRELLFAHWVVDASVVRPLIPARLQLDLFEDRCYVGAVPFLMERVTPRLVPPLPGLHAFPELNLRTYVTLGGKPGVWFFSLDAGQKLAVRVARRLFHLPYFDARFEIAQEGGQVNYSSVRTHRGASGEVQCNLPGRRPDLSVGGRDSRRLVDRALLPLFRRCPEQDISRRNRPSAVAVTKGGGNDSYEYIGGLAGN
jgi:hypothetical protein